MKIYKTLFWITLMAGIVVLMVGIFLQITNQKSSGNTAGRYGEIHLGMINGFVGIYLGILFLLLSIWTYRIYKVEKKKFDKMQ